ncbi:hypothetical protein ABPG72_017987 [Tetrahymena utriculariae]
MSEGGIQKLVMFFSDQGKKKKRLIDNKKKNIEYADKEVWNITGGLFPLIPTSNNKSKDEPVRQWSYSPIVQKSQQISSILHWVPVTDKDKLFSCEKFNIKIDLVDFNEEQYNEYLKELDPSWDYEETKYLWDLCQRFDLRFIIIADRYDEKKCRSIEDIKQRFYSVTRRLLEIRNQQNHALYNYKYDPEYERVRKFELEKFLMRTKETTEQEKILLENLKKTEVQIKREEREHQTLQKMLKEQMNDDNDIDNEEDCVRIVQTIHEQGKKEISNPTESICYLRGKWLNEPLPISEKMNKKLNLVLNELCIPSDFIATEENEQIFEDLREQIFNMFNLQKSLKKKEMIKKQLEDKKRKLMEDLNIQEKAPSSPTSSQQKRPNPYVQETQNLEKVNKKVKAQN